MVSFQPAPHPRILEFSSLTTVNSELRSSSTKRRGWSRFRTRGQAASCKDLPVWTCQSLLLPSPPTHNASVTPGGEAEIPGRSSDIVGGGGMALWAPGSSALCWALVQQNLTEQGKQSMGGEAAGQPWKGSWSQAGTREEGGLGAPLSPPQCQVRFHYYRQHLRSLSTMSCTFLWPQECPCGVGTTMRSGLAAFWTVGGAPRGGEPSALGTKHSGCRYCSWHAQVVWTTHLLLGLKMFTYNGGITVSHHPVNPKGNQPWIFIGRTDVEAKISILWPPDAKNWLIGKDPDAGKDWRQEEKGTTENEMVGWYHWLNGHEFEQTPGDSEGQGSLACFSLWDHKKLDMT